MLRDLFADLMAYALFFQASCSQDPPELAEVREKITALLDEQDRRAKAGDMNWEGYREARFAVLAWLDELILNSAWPHRSQWQHLMLKYYGTLNAGEEFFERVERLPSGARDVREIYYLCLKLGFQGKYAVAGKPDELRQLQHDLYRQLAGAPGDGHRVFPEAYRKVPGEGRPRARHPFLWIAIAALVPALLFVTYLVILQIRADRLVGLPPPPPAVRMDWVKSLIEALREKGIRAHDTLPGVVITLPDLLFEVDRFELRPGAEEKIADVARIAKQYAPERIIRVEGHASREPGAREERNVGLSANRAQKVTEILISNGIRGDKVWPKGLGSSQPVAPNDTEEGRRKNRRVEMVVVK